MADLNCILHIQNLTPEITIQSIKETYEKGGTVNKIILGRNEALVFFDDEDEAEGATVFTSIGNVEVDVQKSEVSHLNDVVKQVDYTNQESTNAEEVFSQSNNDVEIITSNQQQVQQHSSPSHQPLSHQEAPQEPSRHQEAQSRFEEPARQQETPSYQTPTHHQEAPVQKQETTPSSESKQKYPVLDKPQVVEEKKQESHTEQYAQHSSPKQVVEKKPEQPAAHHDLTSSAQLAQETRIIDQIARETKAVEQIAAETKKIVKQVEEAAKPVKTEQTSSNKPSTTGSHETKPSCPFIPGTPSSSTTLDSVQLLKTLKNTSLPERTKPTSNDLFSNVFNQNFIAGLLGILILNTVFSQMF